MTEGSTQDDRGGSAQDNRGKRPGETSRGAQGGVPLACHPEEAEPTKDLPSRSCRAAEEDPSLRSG